MYDVCPSVAVWLAKIHTGFSSEIGTKLRELAVGQAGGSCYSRAALSSNDSKTLYTGWNGACVQSIFLPNRSSSVVIICIVVVRRQLHTLLCSDSVKQCRAEILNGLSSLPRRTARSDGQ